MGEVWRAHDLVLNRDVAIKSLPDALANDPDRLARFDREARLLATLNHPNIAAIHGLEEASGTRVLVMELVEGPTLADTLRGGALPVTEALPLALQIAESLEAAHEKGIVHRDLKPANIKITPEGRIKVLDFGLAKAIDAAPADAPTEMVMRTEIGVVLGTPSYMSPEQARGEIAGRQSDVWSFGVVLCEMLTGETPADLARLPPDTPRAIRDLIRRCLEKQVRRRVQHMGDVRIAIEDALAEPRIDTPPVSTATIAQRNIGRVITVVAAVLVAGGLGWVIGRHPVPARTPGPIQLSMPFAERPFGVTAGSRNVAISRDGTRVAYAGRTQVWIRPLQSKEPRAVGIGYQPFFSPTGEWIGMFRPQVGLIKVPVGGGSPVVLAKTSERTGGATWAAGAIVFATTEGLYRVADSGGDVRLLVKPNPQRNERLFMWPHFLPDGRSLLYTIIPAAANDAPQIALLDLDNLESRTVMAGGSGAQYIEPGRLVYASGAALKTVAFDARTRETSGDAASLDIAVASSADNAAADFAVSSAGNLVYLLATAAQRIVRSLSWIDRQGHDEPLALEPGTYNYPRVSPDGRLVALDVFTGPSRDVWILNLERSTFTQLTDGPTEDMTPIWSRDGRRVFFASNRSGTFDVYSQAADGAAGARAEFVGPGFQAPQSFTIDGKGLIVYQDFNDLRVVTLGNADRSQPLLTTQFDERNGQISPDGDLIAYESNESGARFEIFVRPFPDVAARRDQVSIDGGRYPVWSRPGSNELYYVALDGAMMAVSVSSSPTLKLGRPTKLFQSQTPTAGVSATPYSVSPIDGRFLVARNVQQSTTEQTQVSVLLNGLRPR